MGLCRAVLLRKLSDISFSARIHEECYYETSAAYVTREMRLYNVPVGRRDTGNIGETVACHFLERKGYKIIKRNFLRPWGEIDIVAEKGGTVRFVEVKAVSRESKEGVTREMSHQPEDLVDVRKLRKVARTAVLYMEAAKDDREYQIDVVGVILDQGTRTARCRLLEQALDEL